MCWKVSTFPGMGILGLSKAGCLLSVSVCLLSVSV